MRSYRFQVTIWQLLVVATLVGVMVALMKEALRGPGNERAIMAIEIVWFTSPVWGSIGLALLPPSVTRGLFLASLTSILPYSGYFFFRFATLKGPIANEWLLWSLAFLWLILPFGIGHLVSKKFHSWRATNREKRNQELESVPAGLP
jgi:hypothetical protein